MDNDFKNAIEALLFASERPLSAEEMKVGFSGDVSTAEIREALEALMSEYEAMNRGFKLYEIAGGYQVASDIRYADTLKRFYESREKKKFSQAALETLSVIAYRQPVTRADIEAIRGVTVDGAVKTLLERSLVKIVGRKDVPGRPLLYGTTQDFLERFGLKSIKELPALSEYTLKDLDPSLLPAEMKQEGAQIAEENTTQEPTQDQEQQESVTDEPTESA